VELFGLLWTAFNWQRGIVVVRQGKSGSLKTVIPPSPYLVEASERYVEGMRSGIPIVCHRAGRKVLDYRTAWDKAVKDAGLPHFRFYDVRHMAATAMLAAGADLAAVSAQLGHSNVTTTGNVYAHVTAGSQQKAAALLPSLELPE
jgi:integrase